MLPFRIGVLADAPSTVSMSARKVVETNNAADKVAGVVADLAGCAVNV